jgi:SAM-dependent methyltransferase
MGIYGYQAVLVAHHLKLFPLLAGGARTIAEIGAALDIGRRPAEALLTVCASLGLVTKEGGRYTLTPVSEDYLLETGPAYFGGFLDYTIANQAVFTFEGLKKAVLTNAAQVYGGEDLYRSHEERADRARAFTRMMHSHSAASAPAWPAKIDLAGHGTLLDVGGGSGAHAISAARRWPNLSCVVLDLPPVCDVAREYIARSGLEGRVRAQAGDIWTDPFPPADVHFYSDVYHDFPPEKCRFLTEKSFGALAPGGRIIIHEMLYNDEKTGPFPIAGYNVSMLVWTEGQQFSGPELAAMLAQAGFLDVQVTPTFGYWGIVTGRKP